MDFLARMGNGRVCLAADDDDSMRRENGDAEQMGQGRCRQAGEKGFPVHVRVDLG